MIASRLEELERLIAQASRTRDAFVRGVLIAEARAQASGVGPIASHVLVLLDALEREAEVRA